MYRKVFYMFLLPAALTIMINACAKISSPTGGPRDRTPPVVLKSVPENATTNFKGNSLVTTFDEYVVLDNINEKFMVSPPMAKKPRIFMKGKNVIVEFEEELKDSTTYTFYFQDAIKDLNEGNIFENFQFVFSTGPVIDSLSVTGNVFNSFNLEAPENTLVLMFSNQDDSAVVKNLPDYISRVDQTGYFRFNNLRSGTYRLFALVDIDNSKNYNLIEEEFAFMDSAIVVTPEKNFLPEVIDSTTLITDLSKGTKPTKPDLSNATKPLLSDLNIVPEPVIKTGMYQLFLFTGPKTEHYLTSSSRALKYQMIYTLSLPPDSMEFDFSIPGEDENSYFMERSSNRDTIKIWMTDSTLYSQQEITTMVKYPFTDTLGVLGYKEDTILMRFIEPRATRGTKIKKPSYNLDVNIRNGSIKPGQQIVLKSLTPFRQADTTRIRFYEIADTLMINVPYNIFKDSTNSCRYFLNSTLLPGKKYLFMADSASFGNIYNESIDSVGIKFFVREEDSYGRLTMNISNYEGDRIIQLLNNADKLVQEVYMKNDGDVVFPLIESGFYRVRVIYDMDGDGKWTTGDFSSGRQPEPVSYYPQELDIKVNFYLEQLWDIGLKNVKEQKLRAKIRTRF